MKISVTQEDIDTGSHMMGSCPIALAIQRAGYKCIVTTKTVYFDFNTVTPTDLPLPKEARSFVCKFDANESVQPFEFDLDI
jgi:hypothetical protein